MNRFFPISSTLHASLDQTVRRLRHSWSLKGQDPRLITRNGPVFLVLFYAPIDRKASQILARFRRSHVRAVGSERPCRERAFPREAVRAAAVPRLAFPETAPRGIGVAGGIRKPNAARMSPHTPRLARSEVTRTVRSAAASVV